MAFDPTLPATGSPNSSAEMRGQLTALKALIDAQAVATGRVVADWSSSAASFGDVPGLAWTVANGENWSAEMVLHAIGGPSGQGLKFRVSGPGGGSVMIAIQGTGSSGSTAMECEVQTAFGVASPAKTFCLGTSLTGVVRVHVVIAGASAGVVQLQAASSSAGSAVTIKVNSNLVTRRVG